MISWRFLARFPGLPLIFLTAMLVSGCFESYTRANRVNANTSTVTAGAGGMQYISQNLPELTEPFGFGAYFLAYEYDFSSNMGIAVFHEGRLYDTSLFRAGAMLAIDLMPREWWFHVIWTPGLSFLFSGNNFTVAPAGTLAINLGIPRIQVYGAFSILLMPKFEAGFYVYPIENWFVNMSVGSQIPMTRVFNGVSVEHYYLSLNGSTGFSW